jgi:magnesium transporter
MPVMAAAGMRSRWLSINLVTASLSAVVISFFDTTITQVIALAALMPIVSALGGNAATQALTVVTRALATRQISTNNIFPVIRREALVGFMNGFLLATVTGVFCGWWFASLWLGLVFASALVLNFLAAGLFGAAIPILLHRMGYDPAIASGVFLTALTDIIGFFAFLGLASIILL